MYLNCHTYFSFKYGTLSQDELFLEAKTKGIRKLILTDINNTSAWVEFARLCNERRAEYDLEFSVGIEFREDNELLYIGIAQHIDGFEKLNKLLSEHDCENKPFPRRAPELEKVYIVYPFQSVPTTELRDYEYIGIKIRELNKLITSPLKNRLDKFVILHPVTLKDKKSYNIHRLLRAIDKNTILTKLTPEDLCEPEEFMLTEEELLYNYRHYPQIIENTKRIIDNCHFEVQLHKSKNKKKIKTEDEDRAYLKKLTMEGLYKRYGSGHEKAEARAETELAIIEKMEFESYFLITYDIVEYAKSRGFAHVGRGSGANSITSYCLGITDVDPIELDLYFERFLNPERSSPPDFDIDFSWKDRDEIIGYILKKYGPERAALLANYATFQGRSTLRELGKVFGLPKSEIDEIAEYPDKHKDRDHITKLIFAYGDRIKNFPKNLSIHAGGILISEDSLFKYTALSLPPKGFPTVHMDMYAAEDLGYYKYDILSQRGLGHIKDTVEIVRKNVGKEIDIHRFKEFKADPKINHQLQTGEAIGCFYVESPAMRMLLAKLECNNYPTLVAASSIIRPGVASSGMMREYIFRHHNPTKFTYIDPIMKDLMSETYGVMVYQEDVIKVAHKFAGLTLSQADVLRRGMSGKYRHRREFQLVGKAFFDNCKKEGHTDAITQEVWRQIESFSGYSFSKAHSASYAVESYQSLFLKAYYPLEFMVAVINNFGGFYRTEFYFHEARKSGADLQPPCVNKGHYLTSIEGKKIYAGFIHLKNLDKKIGERIALERELNGDFTDLNNFIERIPVGIEQISVLIRIGAFRFTRKSKRTLLWEAFGYLGKGKPKHINAELFYVPAKKFELPILDKKPFEDAFDEIELLEFPLCNPFDLLDSSHKVNPLSSLNLRQLEKKTVEIIGYLVTTKDTWTRTGIPMNFGTFLDYQGDSFDTVHFPDIAKRFPFLGKGFYFIKGKVVLDFGYPMIEATFMRKIPMSFK